MRFAQLWGLTHLPPNLVFVQDSALTLVTTASLTSELLKMLRQFWRWNGHLIQIPGQSPFPVMLLLHLVLTAEGEELRPNEKYPRFSSHDDAQSSQLKQLQKGLEAEPLPCTFVTCIPSSLISSIQLFKFYKDLFWTKLWKCWIHKIE